MGRKGVVLRTLDGGKTWEMVRLGEHKTLWSLALTRSPGVRTCPTGRVPPEGEIVVWIAASPDPLLCSGDLGITWGMVSTPRRGGAHEISFSDSQRGVAIGDYIFVTIDGGRTWSEVDFTKGEDDFNFRALYVRNDSIYISHEKTTIMSSRNFGKSWKLTDIPGPMPWRIKALDDSRAWLLTYSGTIFSSGDGGHTWEERFSPYRNITTLDQVDLVFRTLDLDETGAGCAVGVYQSDRFAALVCTTDGGRTWLLPEIKLRADLFDVKMTRGGTAWVVGWDSFASPGGTVVLRCETVSRCSVVGRLAGKYATGILFADKDRLAVEVYYGQDSGTAIVRTLDKGFTWQEVSVRGQRLRHFSCIDWSFCWGVSEKLLLQTVDGGSTWELKEFPAEHTPLDGVTLHNRLEGFVWSRQPNSLLHTRDGGMTWLRENVGFTEIHSVQCPSGERCWALVEEERGKGVSIWRRGLDAVSGATPTPTSKTKGDGIVLSWDPPPPNQVNLGESFQVAITLTNNGPRADRGGISISFPQLTSAGSVSSRGPYDAKEAKVETVTRSDSFSHGVGYFDVTRCVQVKGKAGCVPHPYLLVEANHGPWQSGESKTLVLKVTPKQAGWLTVQVRGWLCSGGADGYGECRREPSASSTVDQQGWPVYVKPNSVAVTVKESLTYRSPKGYFTIKYTITGDDAVAMDDRDSGLFTATNAPDYVELVGAALDRSLEALAQLYSGVLNVPLDNLPKVTIRRTEGFGEYKWGLDTLSIDNTRAVGKLLDRIVMHELNHWVQDMNDPFVDFPPPGCIPLPGGALCSGMGWMYEGSSRWIERVTIGSLLEAMGKEAFAEREGLEQKSSRGYGAWWFWHFLQHSPSYSNGDPRQVLKVLREVLKVGADFDTGIGKNALDEALRGVFGPTKGFTRVWEDFISWMKSGLPLGGEIPVLK